MKKSFLLICLVLFSIGCKNSADTKESIAETPNLIRGEFIATDMGAVVILEHSGDIYGIEPNAILEQLKADSEKIKREPYESTKVVLTADIKENTTSEGWEKIISIKEVLHIERNLNNNNTIIQSDSDQMLQVNPSSI
ncbi:MAG: hypothetical protein RQ756_06615 [Flavobacteriaceae bacterium]|nr:hypothetical protein [Flavobacteriaceae bacterium]